MYKCLIFITAIALTRARSYLRSSDASTKEVVSNNKTIVRSEPRHFTVKVNELTNVWTESVTAPTEVWYSTASSADGQYYFAGVNDGYLYASITYGATWNAITSVPSSYWFGIACSSSGQLVVAVALSLGIYYSDTYGQSYTATSAPAFDWMGVASSSSGAILAAVASNEFIYISSDYGVDWAVCTGSLALEWSAIAMSSSGEIMAATTTSNGVFVSTNAGSSFSVMNSAPVTSSWTSVTMSSTGQYMVATVCSGAIYYSSTFGSTWTAASVLEGSSKCFQDVSSSTSGQYLVAAVDSGYLYMSSNYGEDWVPTENAPSTQWSSVSSSSTGEYVIATVSDGGVYLGTIGVATTSEPPTSTPTGGSSYSYTWTQPTEGVTESLDFFCVSSSSSGQYLAAGVYSSGDIFLSSTYGQSWTVSTAGLADWLAIDSSSSGQIIAAAATPGGIYVSTNYGASWSTSSASGDWVGVSVDSSGALIAAVLYSGGIYLSTTYGETWSLTSAPTASWTTIAVSGSSGYIVAATDEAYLYISADSGSTWIQATSTADLIYKCLAISDNGQFIMAGTTNAGMFYSMNFGEDWAQSSLSVPLGDYYGVASSASGAMVAAVTNGGFLYVSNDYGVSFDVTPSLSVQDWTAIASDASGSQLVATVNGGGFFVGTTTQVPSYLPSPAPVGSPTVVPGTEAPSQEPTLAPSQPPSVEPSVEPSATPTNTAEPTVAPSQPPSQIPSVEPTQQPSVEPTVTSQPSSTPSSHPISSQPSSTPSSRPASLPTSRPTQKPSTPRPTVTPSSAVPTQRPQSPTRTPSFHPTPVPSVQNSPIVTFTSNVTLEDLSTSFLDAACQSAIVVTTAQSMGIATENVVFVGSSQLVAVNRRDRRRRLQTTYDLVVTTQTSMSVASSGYSNSSQLYSSCVSNLDQSVVSGVYSQTLQQESEASGAVATMNAVATLAESSLPVVLSTPTFMPSPAPTYSTAPGVIENIGTIVPGVVLFALVLVVLYLRNPMALALNELNSLPGELCDALIKCLLIVLSLNVIADYSSDTKSVSFVLLVMSKLALFLLWGVFIIAFFIPVKTAGDNKDGVQLALLLHKEPWKIRISFSVYGLLVTMSLFDLTFLRLMPWVRTPVTENMMGYPNVFMLRCCLYGTFFSHLIQSLAIIIRISFESNSDSGAGEDSTREKAYLLLAFSVFNVFRAFISMIFIVRVAQSEKLKLTVVNEADVAALADFVNNAERNTMSTDATGSKKQSFTPSRVSDMLWKSESSMRSTSSAANSVVNPIIVTRSERNFSVDQQRDSIPVSEYAESVDAWREEVPRFVGGGKAETVMSDVTGNSDTEVDERGIRFSASTKFADQTLAILRNQLKKEGKVALEFIPLADLKAEIAIIFSKANNGVPYDEARLDYLLMCMDFNPEYKLEKEEETRRWRNEIGPFASDSLETMRGFVPPYIFHASLASLTNDDKMSPELAKRIITKKCLWLVRISTADIGRMHIAELTGRFNPEAQGLDIVEIAAIFAAIPEKFSNDPDGKKERWRASLEQNLKNLVIEKSNQSITKSKLRNAAYKGQEPLYSHRETLHEMHVTSGEDAFKPRSSFRNLSSLPVNSYNVSTMPEGVSAGGGNRDSDCYFRESADQFAAAPRASLTNLNDRSSISPLPPRISVTTRAARSGSLRGSVIGETLNRIFASNLSSGNSVSSKSNPLQSQSNDEKSDEQL